MMLRGDRRVLLMLALLLSTGLAASAMRPGPEQPHPVDIAHIPLEVADWQGRDLGPFDATTLDMLQPDAAVNRDYHHDAARAHLAVIFGRRKATFHSPGFCLLGGGWNIAEKSRLALPGGVTVNRFLLTRGELRAIVLYYYGTEGGSTPSWVMHQAGLAWQRVRGQPAMGALVRLVVPVGGDDRLATERGAELLGLLHPHIVRAMSSSGEAA